jgi:hypothetical protein
MMAKLEIEILPVRLVLISLEKPKIKENLHAILDCAFYSKEYLFSYTETPQNVSLIVEAKFANLFNESQVNVCPTVWRCVEVFAGESGGNLSELSKIIHTLAEPFAVNAISIFQLSTFSSDFTLVPEERLKDAIDCLKDKFHIINPEEDLVLQDVSIYEKVTKAHEESSNKDTVATDEQEEVTKTFSSKHVVREPVRESVYIASLQDPTQAPLILQHIIRRIMFSRENGFFNFTVVDNSYSFVLDEFTYAVFPDVLNLLGSNWTAIEIGSDNSSDGLGFDESGIVATYTAPLAQSGISCFYISTFLTDFVLVQASDRSQKDSDFERAKELLKNKQ